MLNTKTRRAIGLLVALHKRQPQTRETLANHLHCSQHAIDTTIAALKSLEIIVSFCAGRKSGYSLTKGVREISMYDIINSVNGWPAGDQEWNYFIQGVGISLRKVSLYDVIMGARGV